jgi:hypothetical protein
LIKHTLIDSRTLVQRQHSTSNLTLNPLQKASIPLCTNCSLYFPVRFPYRRPSESKTGEGSARAHTIDWGEKADFPGSIVFTAVSGRASTFVRSAAAAAAVAIQVSTTTAAADADAAAAAAAAAATAATTAAVAAAAAAVLPAASCQLQLRLPCLELPACCC